VALRCHDAKETCFFFPGLILPMHCVGICKVAQYLSEFTIDPLNRNSIVKHAPCIPKAGEHAFFAEGIILNFFSLGQPE
jgi:hypothetical protein